ncbi:MAG: FtsQ-type POTRA domain-containing protein, partial [Acidimicrobiia bacterium]|nr:FtsQ-type POTRA domain-containing protein [Acidimicrobiia bacterium]
MTVVAVVAGGYWLLRSPLFSVDHVDVVGVDRAPVASILAQAGVIEGTPIIDIDPARIEAALETDRWVADATVERSWSGLVRVTVTERVPLAMVTAADQAVVVAADGVVLEEADPGGLPTITAPGEQAAGLARDPVVSDLLAFVDRLSPNVRQVTSLTMTEGQVEGTVAGYPVRIGRPDDPLDKADALMAVLATNPEPGSTINLLSADRPAVAPPTTEPAEES